jgi:hypothetical protein
LAQFFLGFFRDRASEVFGIILVWQTFATPGFPAPQFLFQPTLRGLFMKPVRALQIGLMSLAAAAALSVQAQPAVIFDMGG